MAAGPCDRCLRPRPHHPHPVPKPRRRAWRQRGRPPRHRVGRRPPGRPRLDQDLRSGADASIDAPAPPAGTVTVTGWIRQNATGSSAKVSDGEVAGHLVRRDRPDARLPRLRRLRRANRRDAVRETGPGRPRRARPQHRTALLLRRAVVLLRHARRRILGLLRLRRVPGAVDRRPRPPEPAARPAKTP